MSETAFVLGKVYKRPCVRAAWCGRVDWYPVIGPLHEDNEFIGFQHQHFHVDYRFLPFRARDRSYSCRVRFSEVFGSPISTIAPLLDSPLECFEQGHVHAWSEHPFQPMIRLDDLPHEGVPLESYYATKQKKFLGDYPEYPSKSAYWIPKMEEVFKEAKLKPGMICPHRGADLSGISPDPVDGTITCPLHGLRWCVSTGELAPRAANDLHSARRL